MNPKKVAKVEKTKEFLDQQGIFYEEKSNGHLRVDNIDYWATSEKWYDPKSGKKGQGMNSFIRHITDNELWRINNE